MKYINEKREDMDEALFQAEYQQNPIPPEEFLFSPNRLETYNWDTLPEQIKSDINTECWAFIDPTRRGNDFFAMGILKRYKVKDYTSKWYLVDCIFEQKPSKDLIPKVFIKTRQHKKLVLKITSMLVMANYLEKQWTIWHVVLMISICHLLSLSFLLVAVRKQRLEMRQVV